MASGFPGSIDNFTNPLSNSALSSPSHSGQHSDVNDAVNKIETYMGLVKVIPTAATNGTVAANGTVTIGNAVSSVTVTCFSSLYDNYRIIYSGGTFSALALMGIYMGNATAASGYYGAKIICSTGGAVIGNFDNNGGQWQNFGVAGTSYGDVVFDLLSPFTARPTHISAPYFELNGASSYMGNYSGILNNTTSYTQFTIDPQGATTMTGGTIRVYGYRN